MKTIEAKVVVLGSQGVGKTSLIIRYVEQMFSPHITPTIGASFFTCKINIEDTRIKLQVWDTAGQERFRSMAPMYYRNSNAALLVFDISQADSFLAVKSWVKELKRNVEELMVLTVVGNKSDLSKDRTVSREEAMAYASSIGGKYFECSALQNNGVEEVFLNTGIDLIALSEKHPNSGLRIYETLDNSTCATSASVSNNLYVTENEIQVPVQYYAHADVEKSSCC